MEILDIDLIMGQRLKVGQKLRFIREDRGFSQDQLAELMNVSRSTISKIENGKFSFSIDYLARLSLFLNFEVELTYASK